MVTDLSTKVIRKKNEIGKCRGFYSEKLLYLKLLLKMSCYSSGNQTNFGKGNFKDFQSFVVICNPKDFFNFQFNFIFSGSYKLQNNSGAFTVSLFRFFTLLFRKMDFFWQMKCHILKVMFLFTAIQLEAKL